MDIPPKEGKMWFGNAAFKDFYDRILPLNNSFVLSL